MHHAVFILRSNFHGGVFVAGGRSTDQQRNLHASTLHLFGDVDHFIQRRSDQTRQTDHVNVVLDRFLKDLLARDHHTQVNDFVVVTAQYHANDIFTDVMHVAFNGRQQNLAAATVHGHAGCQFFFFHERQQVSDRFFHHASGLDHLRQKHFPATK